MQDLEQRRKHAWDYFQFHAQQRLTTFNFFIIFSSLLLGGLLTTFQDKYHAPSLGAGAGLILVVISFVFWKLDSRNKQLIKNAEGALRELEAAWPREGAGGREPLGAVFLEDAAYVTRARGRSSWKFWNNHLSFSDCFSIAYGTMALVGLAAAVFALIHAHGAAFRHGTDSRSVAPRPIPGIQPYLQPTAHTLQQVREDLEAAVQGLTTGQLWHRPGSSPAIGYHLYHLPGGLEWSCYV